MSYHANECLWHLETTCIPHQGNTNGNDNIPVGFLGVSAGCGIEHQAELEQV